MIPFPHLATTIISIFIIVYPTKAQTQTKLSCKSITYPFGFTDSNPIRLHCNNNSDSIELKQFKVTNITSKSIFVNLPAKCNRSIQFLKPLFDSNNSYLPTLQNSLLLQNCNETIPNGCVLATSLFRDRFDLKSCDSKWRSDHNNISCFTQQSTAGNKNSSFMRFEEFNATTCKSLFSSIVVDSERDSPALSLQLENFELEWWLSGTCGSNSTSICSKNSLCEDVKSSHAGIIGFRCRCKDGLRGDGYTQGQGCRKISDCNVSSYLSGDCGGKTKVRILLVGIVAGASIVAGLCLLCYFARRRSACLKNQMSAKLLLSAACNSSIPMYPYKEIERATNGFSEKERLGTGAFGTVYAGKLHNDECVAIKKIKYRDNNSIDQVLNEIKLLSSVSHPNLVRLLGCCIEEGEQILVYEFMPNGTLSQHLQRERGTGLPWTIRLTIASETAQAIAYLHSAMNPPIYHRDIKSSNILLDYSFKSKVADFGLSRLGMTETSHISTAPQGTPGYVDPQYHQNFHLSDKSDVYSFGVVLIEIITALKVVDFSRPQSEVNLAALAMDRIGKGCIDEIIDPLLDLHRDAWTLYSVHKVAELAFRCLAFHSDMRPTMMEVAEELEHIRRSGWTTFEENICMASSVVSSCSSPRIGSEKSLSGMTIGKAGMESQRLIVLKKVDDCLASLAEVKDGSPVSVHEPWLSDQSPPSTNSLLGKGLR